MSALGGKADIDQPDLATGLGALVLLGRGASGRFPSIARTQWARCAVSAEEAPVLSGAISTCKQFFNSLIWRLHELLTERIITLREVGDIQAVVFDRLPLRTPTGFDCVSADELVTPATRPVEMARLRAVFAAC